MSNNNSSLLKALNAVNNDEYYTHIEDIEKEVINYKDQLRNKSILLNCNDASFATNGFYSYFLNNFNEYQLKELVAMNYNADGPSFYYRTTNGVDIDRIELTGNGAFNSEEGIELLDKCDVVITNPPFSLFRDFIDIVIEHNKLFLVIGNQNAFSYVKIFDYFYNNKIWTGYNMVKQFSQPDGNEKHFGNICWFSNIPTGKTNQYLNLTAEYDADKYPKYDNCDAIEVSRLANIPKNYDGLMGVPITILDKYNPNQFELVRLKKGDDGRDVRLNGKKLYARIFIKNKK